MNLEGGAAVAVPRAYSRRCRTVISLCFVATVVLGLYVFSKKEISVAFSVPAIKVTKFSIDDLEFIHIPKTGGTSMEKFGLKIGKKWGMHKFWGNIYQYALPCAPWHIPPHFFLKNPYAGKQVFCIFRDPWKRILSEFRYQKSHTAQYPWIDKYECTKKSLNDWIFDNLEPMTRWNARIVNLEPFYPTEATERFKDHCHLLSQYEFIFDSNGVRSCHYVLRLENLFEDFQKLKNIFHFDGNLEHDNKSNKCTNLKIDDMNEISKNLIKNYYEEDLKIMNNEEFPWFLTPQ
jgi:hypothetical protein